MEKEPGLIASALESTKDVLSHAVDATKEYAHEAKVALFGEAHDERTETIHDRADPIYPTQNADVLTNGRTTRYPAHQKCDEYGNEIHDDTEDIFS